ncbi:GGDEF domain-containing protein [Pseudoalteromonas sp.]|uniref:GGDEF domain-containing protein n=2 Tax=Pseudoalteromonas TaxID=53246 RepID=UPI003F949B3B
MLHLPTVIGISLLLNILISCFFFTAYHYKKQSYYLCFATACALFASAEILTSLRIVIDSPFITHYLASLAIIASPILVTTGIERISPSKKNAQQPMLALFGISAITLIPIYTHPAGQLVTSLIIGFLFLYSAYLIHKLQSNVAIHQKILTACFISHGFIMLYQGALLLLNIYGYTPPVSSQTLNTILINHLILTTVCSFLLPFIMFADDEAKLRDLANQDLLSTLLNRRGLFIKGEELRQEVIKHNKPISMIMVDIDYFKSVNDKYGHSIGDSAIQWISQHIKALFSDIGVCARIGGEEFAIILPNHTLIEAKQNAEKLHECIRKLPLHCQHFKIHLSISVGVSCSQDGTLSINELLKSADRCLYIAKKTGRDKVVIQDEKSLLIQL